MVINLFAAIEQNVKDVQELVNIGAFHDISKAIEYVCANKSELFKSRVMERCEQDFMNQINSLQ